MLIRKLRYLLKSWAMWRWIGAKPKRNKWMYLDQLGIKPSDKPLHNCYLCAYDNQGSDCLVDWEQGKQSYSRKKCGHACEVEGSLYLYWFKSMNRQNAELSRAYAEQIARLHKETIKRLIKETLRWR